MSKLTEFLRVLRGASACPAANLPSCLKSCQLADRASCQALCRGVGIVLAGIVVSLCILCTLGGPLGHESVAQEPVQHVVEVGYSWDDGHVKIATTEKVAITYGIVFLELRDDQGKVIAEQSKLVSDCTVAYGDYEPPTGRCGTDAIFTMTVPSGNYQEWAKAVFVGTDGTETYTYTVPAAAKWGAADDRGFYLIGTTAWHDDCPPHPDTPTPASPQPTYTARPMLTPLPTPTCRLTNTPVPPMTRLPTNTPYPTATAYPTQPP